MSCKFCKDKIKINGEKEEGSFQITSDYSLSYSQDLWMCGYELPSIYNWFSISYCPFCGERLK